MSVIRQAREAAGLSQAELARRAGVAKQNLCAIEAGRRPVSRELQDRLLDLTGRPSAAIREHREEMIATIERLGGTNPRVFGSCARGEDLPGSDIDLLVGYTKGRIWDFVTLPNALEELLGCAVDVITDGSLRSAVGDRIKAEAVPL